MSRKKSRKSSKGFLSSVMDIGVFILCVLIIAFVLSRFVTERIHVKNHSMEHTIDDGDSVLIDKISYRFRDPERYDVIVFRQKGTGEELVKRIIGLPFETVQIKNGSFYINGERIDDIEGLDPPEDAGMAAYPVKLSVGEYFVVGDNRKDSIDSRFEQIGAVTSTRITGRVFMRLIPFSKIRFF